MAPPPPPRAFNPLHPINQLTITPSEAHLPTSHPLQSLPAFTYRIFPGPALDPSIPEYIPSTHLESLHAKQDALTISVARNLRRFDKLSLDDSEATEEEGMQRMPVLWRSSWAGARGLGCVFARMEALIRGGAGR